MKRKATVFFCLTLCFLCLCSLCACAVPNSNPERAMASLEEAGYTVTEKRVSALIHFGEGLSRAFEASRDWEVIHVLYYESDSAADTAFETVRTLGDSYRPSGIGEDEWIVKRSGKCIYFGTKQAARDAN